MTFSMKTVSRNFADNNWTIWRRPKIAAPRNDKLIWLLIGKTEISCPGSSSSLTPLAGRQTPSKVSKTQSPIKISGNSDSDPVRVGLTVVVSTRHRGHLTDRWFVFGY